MAKLKAGQKVKQTFLVKTFFVAKDGDVLLTKENLKTALEKDTTLPVVFTAKVAKVQVKK